MFQRALGGLWATCVLLALHSIAASAASTPYTSTAIALPGTFHAVNFENSAQNAGGPTPTQTVSGNIVVYASDIAPTALYGMWSVASDPTSPNGIKLATPSTGWSTANAPVASPADYFDVPFTAAANTPYTIWVRLQATGNSKYSDSVWVQFSDAQVNGAAAYPINSTSGLLVKLASDSTGASDNGWGWVNGAYWLTQAATVTFPTTGPHTLRVQVRFSGVQLDQIILSPTTYFNAAASCPGTCTNAPGPITNDATIVPKPVAPPAAPTAPSPSQTSTGIPMPATLTWTASGATSYDVSIGPTNPPAPVATALASASYAPAGLIGGTTYFWQVVAHNAGGTTPGPVWSFATASSPSAGPPPPPTTPTTPGGAPSTYTAISDRNVYVKPALPLVGAAGASFTDPTFGSPMLRVTDGNTRPGLVNRSYRVASNAHLAAWNTTATYFYVESNDGTIIPYAFNAATMTASRLQPAATGNGGFTLSFYVEPQFSVAQPHLIYGAPSSSTHPIAQYDFSAGVYTTLVDLDTLVSGLAGTYVGGLTSANPAAEVLMVFFGGAAQDQHYYAWWMPVGNVSGGQLLNTVASTINGQPTNIPLNFHLHSAAMDKSGRYVFLYPTAPDLGSPRYASQVYIWDTSTATVTAITSGGHDGPVNMHPGGHDAAGFGAWVNQDCCTSSTWDAAQWQFRSLAAVDQTSDLIAPVLSPEEVYLADHTTWNNAQPTALVPVISSTYRYGTNPVPWRAWDDEILAIQTAPGPGLVWRFAHHRSTVASDNNPATPYFWYEPIANVSPDGKWILFTSNWEKSLGTDASNDSAGAGIYRQDVFIVQAGNPGSQPVTPIDVPAPTVTTNTASGVTATAATLTGTVNPSGSATTAYFQFGTAAGYGSTTPAQSVGAGSSSVIIGDGTITGLTCNTQYHFRAMATNAGGSANGAQATFTTSACATTLADTRVVSADFDGNGKSDIATFRPSTGTWWVLHSSTENSTFSTYAFGASADVPVSGDYDGDGVTDIAVFRPSTGAWMILESSTNFTTSVTYMWGVGTDRPVPGDYDGDGITDIAVFRPSTATWWILESSTNFTTYMTVSWGAGTDVPVPGDYDGDGKADIAVFRPSTGTWWVLQSSTNYTTSVAVSWGTSTDVPVPADYDGDRKVDPAVYRPSTGTWWVLHSNTNYTTFIAQAWGVSTDIPVPSDYDGDGKTDPAVFRPSTGTWWILESSTNYATSIVASWGTGTDTPINEAP